MKTNILKKEVIHIFKKFGLNKKRYTGWNFEDIMIENNFRENWFGINFINKDDFNFDPKNDLVVLPEIFAHFAETMLIKKKIPFVIFVQNGYSIFPTNDKSSLKLAYNKAKYILLNFEASNEVLTELSSLIKFNDNIIRHMFIAQDKKITEPSIMMQNRERA